MPAIGADFCLRLDLSQLSPQGGDVHPDQFAARVFLAPDAPGDIRIAPSPFDGMETVYAEAVKQNGTRAEQCGKILKALRRFSNQSKKRSP